MRRCYTAVIERGETLQGEFATEPYEAGWATEALVFVRLLDAHDESAIDARVQLSPDGMHWIDEGTTLATGGSTLAVARVREFGNWLRVAGTAGGSRAVRVLVYLVLKE